MDILFDLEATCWNDKKEEGISEIIEIGAVVLDPIKKEIVDDFQCFVNPIYDRRLSNFCKELTGITQDNVDSGFFFDAAIDWFYSWIKMYKPNIIWSWGWYDHKQIKRESLLKEYNGDILNLLEEKHDSLKHQFSNIFGCKPCGKGKALKMIGKSIEGNNHRALDDCKNIAKIYFEIYDKLKNK